MKNFIGLLGISCILLVTCTNHDVQPIIDRWQKVNTPYFGEPMDIKFVNADTGYILGAKYSDDSIYNILIKTVDGGQTWKSIAYKDHKFLTDTSGGVMAAFYVSPFNSNILFTGGGNYLLRSKDGGRHWQKMDTVNKVGTSRMHLFDPANGVSIGGGIASKTMDSCYNWTVTFEPQIPINYGLLQFTSNQVGYLAGGTSSAEGDGGGLMARTTDGGNSWQLISYPFRDIQDIGFVNDSIGYLTYFSSPHIYKTIDGGISWNQPDKSRPATNYGTPVRIYFANEKEGFLISKRGVFHTTDGCLTWQQEHTGAMDFLSFPNNNTGYAIGLDRNLYKRK